MKNVFLGNRIADYLICVLLFFGGSIAIKIFRHFLLKRLKRWAEKTATTLDDFLIGIIQNIALPLAYFGVLYMSINILTLNPLLKKGIDTVIMAILVVFIVRLAIALTGYGLDVYLTKRGKIKL